MRYDQAVRMAGAIRRDWAFQSSDLFPGTMTLEISRAEFAELCATVPLDALIAPQRPNIQSVRILGFLEVLPIRIDSDNWMPDPEISDSMFGL